MLFTRTIGGLPMISDASEAAIDQIVASCNGDMRGALKALGQRATGGGAGAVLRGGGSQRHGPRQ